jgi:hypothetical protein
MGMERNLKVVRKYALGQYQNIEFTDDVVNIPEELFLDPEFIKRVRYTQLLGLEEELNKYLQLKQTIAGKSTEEVIALLEEERNEVLAEINKHLTKGE